MKCDIKKEKSFSKMIHIYKILLFTQLLFFLYDIFCFSLFNQKCVRVFVSLFNYYAAEDDFFGLNNNNNNSNINKSVH